jgi:hypothetical protein
VQIRRRSTGSSHSELGLGRGVHVTRTCAPLHPCLLHRGRHSSVGAPEATVTEPAPATLISPPSAVQAHHYPLRPPFLHQARECREELPLRRGREAGGAQRSRPAPSSVVGYSSYPTLVIVGVQIWASFAKGRP